MAEPIAYGCPAAHPGFAWAPMQTPNPSSASSNAVTALSSEFQASGPKMLLDAVSKACMVSGTHIAGLCCAVSAVL